MRTLIRARNGIVAIEDEHIASPIGVFDLVIDAPRAEVRPGLINAHDHLHRNHYGRLGRPPYANAYAWADDIQVRCAAEIAEGQARPRREALLEGAWKNLFSGVTTVVHHDRWEAEFETGFPLHVVRLQQADSLGMPMGLDRIDSARPFTLHLAEGVDGTAAGEVARLQSAGLLKPNLFAVHGVGMDAGAIAAFRASGAALVWCPTSNYYLFGRSAPAALLADGVDVLLGSDSLLTGAGDLLDELRFARVLGSLGDARLCDAVGRTAARRLALPEPALTPGAAGDVILIQKPLLECAAKDVTMVLVAGAPRVLAADVAAAFGRFLPPGETKRRNGVTRWTAHDTAPSLL